MFAYYSIGVHLEYLFLSHQGTAGYFVHVMTSKAAIYIIMPSKLTIDEVKSDNDNVVAFGAHVPILTIASMIQPSIKIVV